MENANIYGSAWTPSGAPPVTGVVQQAAPAVDILSGYDKLQEVVNNYVGLTNQASDRRMQEADAITQRNLNRAGILRSGTGQDILGKSNALVNAEIAANFANTLMPYSQGLLNLRNMIEEGQRTREFEDLQQAKQRNWLAEVYRNQYVNYPLELEQALIPIREEAARRGMQLYKSMFPDTNMGSLSDMMAINEAMGGGGGAGGVGFDDFSLSFEERQAANKKPWDDPGWMSDLNRDASKNVGGGVGGNIGGSIYGTARQVGTSTSGGGRSDYSAPATGGSVTTSARGGVGAKGGYTNIYQDQSGTYRQSNASATKGAPIRYNPVTGTYSNR